MKIQWRLRMAAAQREVWTGTELRRLLAEKAGLELSSASVSALFTKEPSQVKMTTLAALCTALECTPNDLIEVDITPVERPIAPPRPVADLPQAASAARPVDATPVTRRATWARSNGTASPAEPRSDFSTGTLLPLHRRRSRNKQRRRLVRPAAWTVSCRRTPAGASLCSRVCEQCGHPVRSPQTPAVPGLPAQGRAAGRPRAVSALRQARLSARGDRLVRLLLTPRQAKKPPQICRRCGQLRRHAGLGLCSACWQTHPGRPFIRGDHLRDRLPTRRRGWTTSWLMSRPAIASPGVRFCHRPGPAPPGRALQLARRPCWNAPADRAGRWAPSPARWRTSSPCPAWPCPPTRPNDSRLAAANAASMPCPIPAAGRDPAFDASRMRAQDRARRAGTRPRSDHTLETALAIMRDLALFLPTNEARTTGPWSTCTTSRHSWSRCPRHASGG